MSIETQLRDDLARVGEQLDHDPGDLQRVMRTGRRRRTTMTAATGLGVVVGLATAAGLGAILAPGPTPLVGGTSEQVSIVLCDDRICPAISEQEYLDLQARLLTDPDITGVRLESPEGAHERFRETFEDHPELADSIGPEQLATTLYVDVASPEAAERVAERYVDQPGVEAAVPPPGDGTEERSHLGPP